MRFPGAVLPELADGRLAENIRDDLLARRAGAEPHIHLIAIGEDGTLLLDVEPLVVPIYHAFISQRIEFAIAQCIKGIPSRKSGDVASRCPHGIG